MKRFNLSAFFLAAMLTVTLAACKCPFASADEGAVIAPAALEAGFPAPDADIGAVLVQIATNYKTMGLLGLLSLLTLLSVQLIKKFVPDTFKWKRLLALGMAILYSIASGLLVPGSSLASVLITVLLTSGGAMALYETLKGAGVIAKAA
jgi:hypothetical protein